MNDELDISRNILKFYLCGKWKICIANFSHKMNTKHLHLKRPASGIPPCFYYNFLGFGLKFIIFECGEIGKMKH